MRDVPTQDSREGGTLPGTEAAPSDDEFIYHLYRGSELLLQDRVVEAKGELERALSMQPQDAKGQDLLAGVYFRLGVYPRAIEIWRRLVDAYPRDATLRVNLSLALLKTGQPQQALDHLHSALQMSPDHDRAWGYLGVVHWRMGQLAEAREAFLRGGQAAMARRMEDIIASTTGAGQVQANRDRNEGKGSLEWMASEPSLAERYGHLMRDGEWVERDDVQIWFLGRKGNLAPGFGNRATTIGPELGFGWVVGEAIDDAPVLLIKIAWGGKSLAVDFRPPSAGGEVGPYYTQLISKTKDVLANADELFPQFAGREIELAGFGWHQGWNDRVNQQFNDEYEQNMAHFIADVREELDAPDLPFVIAETGMTGPDETHPRALSLMAAQKAVAERAEFRKTVNFVPTRAFWRPADQSPSTQGYHWNNNAETYYLIGEAMGKAMLKLLGVADEKS